MMASDQIALNIGVQLTTRCNLNCVHCFVDGSGDNISMDVLREIVSFAKSHNATVLAFSGGEPTSHPEFIEIMKLLADNGLAFTMITNGWNFVDWFMSARPYTDTIKRVAFSLDGATEDVHDSNRAEGSYRRVMQAASVCRYKNIPFGFRTTVTKRNLHQLEEVTLLAAKIGAGELALVPLQPTPRTASQKLILLPDDLDAIKEEVARFRSIFRMKITLTAGYHSHDPLVLCPPLSMKQLYVTARGMISFCCQLADYGGAERSADIIGRLDEMSMHDAYQRMIEAVGSYNKSKIERLKNRTLSRLDYYPCWYCAKHFGKVDWMKQFPGTPWSHELSDSYNSSPTGNTGTLQTRSVTR